MVRGPRVRKQVLRVLVPSQASLDCCTNEGAQAARSAQLSHERISFTILTGEVGDEPQLRGVGVVVKFVLRGRNAGGGPVTRLGDTHKSTRARCCCYTWSRHPTHVPTAMASRSMYM